MNDSHGSRFFLHTRERERPKSSEKQKNRPRKWWLVLAIAGLLLRVLTHVLSPLHEYMHGVAVVLTGGVVTEIEQTQIWFAGGIRLLILFFGYGGEVLLYGVLATVSKRLGPFWYGALLVVPFHAIRSYDFSNLGPYSDFLLVAFYIGAVIGAGCVIGFRFFGKRDEPKRQETRTARPMRTKSAKAQFWGRWRGAGDDAGLAERVASLEELRGLT